MTENKFDPVTGAPVPPSYVTNPNPNPNPNPAPPPQYGPNPYMEVPPEIRKWNWGAFYFGWVWGVGNKAWLALLCLVPCLGFIWMFVSGAIGNQWAWKSGEFKDVEQFMAVQRTWNRAGLIALIINVGLGVLVAIFFGAAIIAMVRAGSDFGYYDFGGY
jgi:hypothetical protein